MTIKPPARIALAIALHTLAMIAPARAQTIAPALRWVVDVARPAPADWQVYRGESVRLEPVIVSYGMALAVTNYMATLYWQTNGMDTLWWSAPAEIVDNGAGGQVRATWSPTNDVGARTYSYFVGLTSTNPAARQYRAHGRLAMRHAPGYVPNEIALPARAIDFDLVDIRNPPWSTPADLVPITAQITDHVYAPNPHNITPGAIGALPTSGGTITGDVSITGAITGDGAGLTGVMASEGEVADYIKSGAPSVGGTRIWDAGRGEYLHLVLTNLVFELWEIE